MPTPGPLADFPFPDIPPVPGVTLASTACGIRQRQRPDLALMIMAPGSAIAGVFTRSATASPAVHWGRECVARGKGRAILVNSGNANAATGGEGTRALKTVVDHVAARLGCGKKDVLMSSTGVIGVPLPVERIVGAVPALVSAANDHGWLEAATAIMTTDTGPKGAYARARIGDSEVIIAGIAKGSGMIAPNMATMLAYIFTDAKVPAEVLQKTVERANARTFNSITVDSDTSTSDTVIVCATGQGAAHKPVKRMQDSHFADFREKLETVMRQLAHLIVRDGEGATKFISVQVSGAKSEKSARRVGLAIANSPLVKTAVAGEDANWGRIVMAIGKAEELINQNKLAISIGGIAVARKGVLVDGYDEMPVAAHLREANIEIAVELGVGKGEATVWTCDLTHGYIDINADYRS